MHDKKKLHYVVGSIVVAVALVSVVLVVLSDGSNGDDGTLDFYGEPMYTITFDYNDGADGGSFIMVEEGDTVPEYEPYRVGHDFMGWFILVYDEEYPYDSEYVLFDLSTPITEDITLVAEWQIREYEVTFVNWDDEVLSTQTIEHGSPATAPEVPDREGYDFVGWDAEFYNVTGDLTVTAQFEIKKYTVTFVNWDDTVLETQIVEHGSAAVAPEDDPAKVGHTFTGWDVEFCNITDDLTVKAQFIINVYMVSFVHNDGTDEITMKPVEHGSLVEKLFVESVSHDLVAWMYDGEVFCFDTPIVGYMTLVAEWELKTYVVAFWSNGGTAVDPASVEVKHGYTIEEPEAPTRVGHTFRGWFFDDDGAAAQFNFSTPITGDMDLVALWTALRYTVTFDHNDGTDDVTLRTVEHGNTVAKLALSVPKTISHDLVAWMYDGEEFDFSTPIVGYMTLVAEWALKKYTVTFVDWDGTVLNEQIVEHGYGAEAPEEPVREGFRFTGWDLPFGYVTGDMTVTAMYIVTYTVTFVDWNGVELSVQTIDEGSAALAPEDPFRVGYTFTGWNVPFDNITGDLTVTAVYEINVYAVTFVNWNDEVLDVQHVEFSSAATAPANPTRFGYTFTGWDVPFNNITGDLMVTALYMINVYTVTFDSAGGTAIESVSVEHGSLVSEPEEPVRAEHTFFGWLFNGVAFVFEETPITGSITLTASWAELFTMSGQVFRILGSVGGVTQTELVTGGGEYDYVWYRIGDNSNIRAPLGADGTFTIEGIPSGSTVTISAVFVTDEDFDLFTDASRLPHAFTGEFVITENTVADIFVFDLDADLVWAGLDDDGDSGLPVMVILAAAILATLAIGVLIFYRTKA